MLNIVVADVKEFKEVQLSCKTDISQSDEFFLKTLERADITTAGKDKDTLYTRLAAYRVLEIIYPVLYNREYYGVIRDQKGKPHLIECKRAEATLPPKFNLSHSGDLVALVFCEASRGAEFSEIGVDIELHRAIPHEKDLEEKCLKKVNKSLQKHLNLQKNISFYTLSADGKTLNKINDDSEFSIKEINENEICFFDKWTRFEAGLKAQGGGFESLNSETDVFASIYASNYRIKYKNQEYSLSPAAI